MLNTNVDLLKGKILKSLIIFAISKIPWCLHRLVFDKELLIKP